MKGYLSASGLKKYDSCPKQWWFHYVSDEQPGDVDTRYMDLGSAVHDTIEAVLKAGDWDTDAAMDAYAVYAQRHAVADEFIERGEQCVRRAGDYVAKRDPNIRGVEVEERFHVDRPDVDAEFTAKMDVTTDTELWDWKTGSIRDDTPKKEQIQGAVYMAAYHSLYGHPPEKIRFVYLKEEQVRSLDPTDKVWATMLAVARRLQYAKQEDEFDATPGDVCHWCDYAHVCPAFGGVDADFDWDDWMTL